MSLTTIILIFVPVAILLFLWWHFHSKAKSLRESYDFGYPQHDFSDDEIPSWLNRSWPECGGLNFAIFENTPRRTKIPGMLTWKEKQYPFITQITEGCCIVTGQQMYSVSKFELPQIPDAEEVEVDFEGMKAKVVWKDLKLDECEVYRCILCV